MTVRIPLTVFSLAGWLGLAAAEGQVSSIGQKQRERPSPSAATEAEPVGGVMPVPFSSSLSMPPRNAVYDRYSWITARPPEPKKFKVGDLITIIVRERREFEADADLQTRKKVQVDSQLDAFIKLIDGGVGASDFSRGKPDIDYSLNNRLQSEGDTEREDRLTTRLTGVIIDVKPNGVLVLEATARIEHDDEVSTIAITGTCRKEDVTADNTVLSTQMADKQIVVNNQGALRAASSRGWLLKLVDWLSPF